jgi:hypothetical protein
MSGQVTITQLPTASALTGAESVPIVQNGVTKQTTTGAISGAGALNYPFLTVGSAAGLTQGRYLSASTGLSLSDTGAGGTLTINMTGAASSLNAASTGIIVKNATNTVVNRSLAVGSGMTVSNADGVAGNPTLGLSTILQNLSSTTSAGIITLNGSTITAYTLQGVTNQISITNGNGVGGAPTVGFADNPILPGTASVTLPNGSTAQRGTPAIAQLRYNTDLGLLEFYSVNAWLTIATNTGGSAGVTSVATGTGLTGGPITSTGTISIANTTVSAGSYTYASFTVNAQGQLTAASNGGTLPISGGGTGQTTASAAFNALSPITTTGDLIIGNGTNSATRLAIGTSGYILTSNGTTASWTAASSSAVTTFSGGTTGLTPNTATAGAVTLAGTLVVSNGGTGLTSLTTGYIPYGNGTAALASSSGFTFSGTTLTVPSLTVNSTTSTTPNLTFNASNSSITSGAAVSGSYLQTVMQNTSATAGASVNYVLSNNLGTDSTYYGEFGMNSSVFTASGTFADFFSINNGIYFSGHDGDLSVGSGNGFKTYLTWGTTGQSAHVINASGAIGLSTNLGTTAATTGTSGFGTAGYLMQTNGSASAPTWVAQSTITAGTATNINLSAGTGATNYLHFSAAATGSQPTTTNTLLTYNYTNNTITAGISGGAF